MEQNNTSTTPPNEPRTVKQTDLDTILKDLIEISEQLLTEKLSETLLRSVMRSTEADKGSLLLLQENQLSIVAESVKKDGTEVNIFTKIKIPDYNFLPEKIIKEVIETNNSVVINDLSKDKIYSSDKYFSTSQTKSIACIPIIIEKKKVGVIYLENSLFTGNFTLDKIVVLKILAAQAATAFEHIILLNKLGLSEKRNQDIIDNTTAVMFAKLLDGKYLFINKEFEKLYKVKRENVINLNDYDIFPKEFADSFVSKDKLISTTGKPLIYEEKIPHDDGMHSYIIAKFPLLDSAGKLYAIGGIATDISGLKAMEETLRISQNRFNYVLAATQDAIYDWDLISGKIWRNEQYEKLYDGPSGPSLAWWKQNIHPDEYSDMTKKLDDAFKRQEQFWNQNYRFKKVNGGFAYIIDRGFIVYDQSKPVRMIGALMDVSESKLAEETEKKRIVKIIERQAELFRLNNLLINLPIQEKLKRIIESDAIALEVERVSIQMFDPLRNTLNSENTYLLSKSTYGPGVSLNRKYYPRYFLELEFNKLIDANNAESDPRTSELAENYLKLYGITSIMNVPIKLKSKIVGIVCHEHVGRERKWTYEEMTFATTLGEVVSLALESNEREKTEIELKKFNEVLEERIKNRTAELSDSEEKFRAIVESTQNSIISCDREGKITFWNKAAEKMFGYSPNEVMAKDITLIMPPQYTERHKAGMDHYLKTKEARVIGKGFIELSGLRKNGTQFPIELSLSTWKSKDQDFFTASIQDISARKETEKELVKSKELFLKIFDNNPIGMAMSNLTTNSFLDVNTVFLKTFGFTKEEVIGKSAVELNIVTTESREKILNLLKQSENIKDLEILGRKKNGEIFWAGTSIQKITIDGEQYALVSFYDITERKKANETLKQKTEETKRLNIFLNSILENIPNMIFVKEAKELRFVLFNKAGEELLGHKKEEMIGKNDYDFFPKEQADFFISKDKEVLNKGLILDIPEEPIDTIQGKRWLHTRKITIKDESGKPLYLLGISWDITEQKKTVFDSEKQNM